ncbi:hypothetical protein Ccrd_020546, partial [Cynara cardunculus var. scolymus]
VLLKRTKILFFSDQKFKKILLYKSHKPLFILSCLTLLILFFLFLFSIGNWDSRTCFLILKKEDFVLFVWNGFDCGNCLLGAESLCHCWFSCSSRIISFLCTQCSKLL